jgi:hypothetical protein
MAESIVGGYVYVQWFDYSVTGSMLLSFLYMHSFGFVTYPGRETYIDIIVV